IGKLLIIEDQDEPFRVTAIIDKIPANSHFHFDMLASMTGYKDAESTSWMESKFYTYLRLKKGTDYKTLEAKLPVIFERYSGPQIKQALGMSFSEFTKTNKLGLFLQPLTDIHLNSDFSSASTLEQGGNMKTIYIFIAVSIFMLLIACVNFMNLATASATSRAKEVGIKKVLGSEKKQLIYQFLMESFIAVLLAMTLALILVAFTLPFFNNLSNKTLQISYLLNIKTLLSLTVFSVVISLLAGAYPAFYIAAFNPISALKSKFSDSGKNKGLRSGLVVFQFVVSAVLIFATLIVTQQMDYIQTKDLGYDKKQVLVLRESYFLGNNETAFKNKIINDPRVENVTNSGFVPVGASNTEMSGIIINQEFNRRMFVYNIDDQYIPTLGMKLVEGRNFSEDFRADSSNVIINETTSKLLGFEDHPIGKTLTRAINNEGGRQTLTVIGVVKDF
ncbi:MAG: ABC transporter permease, partial [Flavobacteriaceae bacterium]|nr:ABC transporter permease [Flavobacteriaceae bacterium]